MSRKVDLDHVKERMLQQSQQKAFDISKRFLALKQSDKTKIANQFNDKRNYDPVVFVDRGDMSQKDWALAFLHKCVERQVIKDIPFWIAKLEIDG